MSLHYILDGKTPIAIDDILSWARYVGSATHHVALTKHGDIRVSTVFLGLDHSYGDGPPLLFETMIFGGPHDEYQERYSTWDEAEEGHKRACALAGI